MKPYRPNVGICLFNSDGQVFCGRCWSDGPEIVLPGQEWQMPQGGIDENEDIERAARRELQEETGITDVRVIAATDDWWHYDFPPYDGPAHGLDRFRGQRQKWVAMHYLGDGAEIDISRPNGTAPAEFTAWTWYDLPSLVDQVVSYKRPIYHRVAAAFGPLAPRERGNRNEQT